jgi:hypothetical protein
MEYSEQLQIGNRVTLTTAGAKAHRQHHAVKTVGTVAVVTAATGGLAAPLVAGTAVGVAGAFGGVAVNVGTAAAAGGAAAGGAAGGVAAAIGGGPEAGAIGKIVNKQGRWWGKSGHDYEVRWEDGSKSWHLSKHLNRLEA